MSGKGMKANRWTAAILCLLIALPFGFAGRASAETVFTDDFENGTASDWTAATGNWSVVREGSGNVYYQSSTSEGRTSAGSASWKDYSVEAKVKVDNFNGTNRTYVTGRYRDGNNYYAASLYNSGGGKLEIRKK